MLINPFKDKISVVPGTRWLEEALGLAGVRVIEPEDPLRVWTIQWLLAPVAGRALGGVRAKLIDEKGFITFCNQRDLEVLLGYGTPGRYCAWTRRNYPEPGDNEWYGFCCDEEDLNDDLFERECNLRRQYSNYQYLPAHLELNRRVHVDPGYDAEELVLLLWDMDRDTGQYPDTRLETVGNRWTRVERTRVKWEQVA